MKKRARFLVLAGAAMAIASSQVASGAPPAPAVHGGTESVRPTTSEIRTSVDELLG